MNAMLLVMSLMFGNDGETCKVEKYTLFEDRNWYVLDASGVYALPRVQVVPIEEMS